MTSPSLDAVKVGDILYLIRPITHLMLHSRHRDGDNDTSEIRVPFGERARVLNVFRFGESWDVSVSWPDYRSPSWNVKLIWFSFENPLVAIYKTVPLACGLAKVRAR